jgi:hypothetical protein
MKEALFVPVVLKSKGFRFFFYAGDHSPIHLHIEGKGAKAKIAVETLDVLSAKNLSRADLRHILSVIAEHKNEIIAIWNEYHEEEK